MAISPIARRTGGLAVGVSHLVGESAGERVEIAEMGAQVAQHAADGVAVIVGAVLAVVDGVSAAAVRVPLEQAELTEKTLVIGQRDQAAREQRQAFQVNLRPGQLAANVANAAPAPGSLNPFLSKVVADHVQTTVLLGQIGVLFGRFLRIERRRNAAANVDDDALASLCPMASV